MSALDPSALHRSNDRLGRRRAVNRGMEVLAWIAAALAVGLLGVLVWSVAKRGASELNLDLLTNSTRPPRGSPTLSSARSLSSASLRHWPCRSGSSSRST
jgi:ABC-type phosphate transport system permease subunit